MLPEKAVLYLAVRIRSYFRSICLNTIAWHSLLLPRLSSSSFSILVVDVIETNGSVTSSSVFDVKT